MSTLTITRPAATLRPVIGAEWTKVRTLRATGVTVAVALGASVALSLLAVNGQRQSWATMTVQERADFDPVSAALVGVLLTTLVLGSLAARAVTTEYATGMLRTTFTAMPHRRQVLITKAAIVAAVAVAVGLVANAVSFLLGQELLASTGVAVSIGDPGSARAVVFGALGVGLFAVVAVSLGTILRRATTANILLALLVVGGQLIGPALPADARPYLPSAALEALVTTNPAGDTLAPLTALLVLGAGAATLLVVATTVIARRDP